MTDEEIRALLDAHRDKSGRPRLPKAEHAKVISFLRAERAKGLSALELSKRTGLSRATVNKLAPLGRRKRSKGFVRLQGRGEEQGIVIEGAHGLRVRCSNARSAATILAAAAKIG